MDVLKNPQERVTEYEIGSVQKYLDLSDKEALKSKEIDLIV